MSLNEEPDTKEYCVPIYKWNELVEEKLALRTQLAEAEGEVERLKGTLNKAEVVLLNYAPKDMFFPQIEQQWSELMDEIHSRLKAEQAKENKDG